jgi:small ligand-binding sensory domain FIST
MYSSSSVSMLRLAGGLSGHVHPVKAVEHACEQCLAGLGGAPVDLLFAFYSVHHVQAARAIGYALRRRLAPKALLGLSAESVLGGDKEIENAPGLSLLAASLPGVDVHVFRSEMLMKFVSADDRVGLAAAAGFSPSLRGTILLADPFSVPMNTLLPALGAVRPAPDGASMKPAPIIGGMASAAREPGKNSLLLDDQVFHQGCVGVSLSGRIRVDAMVSQGCRTVGPPFVVTGGKGQIVTSLGGRPALQVISEIVESLDEHGKQLMQRGGLFLGRAVNEYKSRFGRDDFLIRPIVSVDRNSEAIAVGELLRIGQTVQLHVRDAETAHEDLEMLLDKERLHDPPAGALLFTCNGRGRRLFGTPDHDAAAVARAFLRAQPGHEEAKGGKAMPAGAAGAGGIMPLAGFFAFGEVGPLAGEVFVHGHTASAAFIRGVAPNMPDV